MTVCEKVPEMLLTTGLAIILGRHRRVSEPVINQEDENSKEGEGLAQACPLPPTSALLPQQGSCSGQGDPGREGVGPQPGP